MAWKIEFLPEAAKEFDKLGHTTQKLISEFLRKKIIPAANPRDFGKPLSGNKSGLWRYRIDRYRIICRIEDKKLVVLVVKVAKRDVVYKK